MDNATSIRQAVQERGDYVALLSTASASRTIQALRADGYGARLIVRTPDRGTELWRIVGEVLDGDEQ